MDGVNNFPSTLQDFGGGKFVLLIVKVLSNLPVPLVSTTTTIVPFWNCHIDNYAYKIFGFANKYLADNGAILLFHDDDTHIQKEIKFILETNGYEIHSKWAIINTLPQMNSEIKGKMVIPLFICIYITLHFQESSWTNFFHSPPCRLD